MKVLISAYACEPNRGSEPGVGWNWALQMARFHQVWVLTRANNHRAIEAELDEHPVANLQFEYYDLPKWTRFWKRGERGVHIYCYLWQIGSYFKARRLHQREGFDLAHHVTIATWRYPSLLGRLGVPFVWGPLGGADKWPAPFLAAASFSVRLYEFLRSIQQRLGQLDPNIRATARAAAIAIAVNRQAMELMEGLGCREMRVLSTANIDKSAGNFTKTQNSGPIKIIGVGSLFPHKAFDLVIKALSECRLNPSPYLTIYGEGKERKSLERLIAELGLTHNVSLPGLLSHDDLLQKLYNADIFIFTGLRDSGGMAILEAMAAGKPTICLDLGGPAEFVTEECGIKIKPQSIDQVVRDMAGAIERLAHDRELRTRMGEAGRQRVSEVYDWKVKGDLMAGVYEEAAGIFKERRAVRNAEI